MRIDYSIAFFSSWHGGAGLAAGADGAELAMKAGDGLPYVPGRTVKGLLRDAAESLARAGAVDGAFIPEVFGVSGDEEGHGQRSLASFSDATLSEREREVITEGKLQDGLFASVSSTAIGDDGIAKDHTLRKLQVAVPCTVTGSITGVPESAEKDLVTCMSMVERMGLGRSRGLGRCEIRAERKGD